MIDNTFFTGNRKTIQEQVGGLIVLAGHSLMQRSRDISFGFEQDKNFWYLSGIDEPDYWLVMTPNEEFIIRPHVGTVENWFEERSSTEQIAELSGIEDVLNLRAGRARLKALASQYKTVHVLDPVPRRYMQSTPNPARTNLKRWLRQSGFLTDSSKLGRALMDARLIKQDIELEQIRRAVNVSIQAFSYVKDQLDSLDWEHEIEAEFTREFRRAGLQHGYDPIIGTGKNATILHYNSNAARLRRGDMILMDIGARSGYYSADITRTYSYQEQSSFGKDVYAVVAAALKAGIAAVKPGISYVDVEKIVEAEVGKGLTSLGLIDEPTRENIRSFYPHSGHFLGLDVHDVGDYHAPLKAGNVLTVEPGIYIPKKGVGIRLEEDILVTKAGCEVLSASLPLAP